MIRSAISSLGRRSLQALRRLRRAPYLRKWLILSTLIGAVAGIGAIAFITALEWASKLMLDGLGGYSAPSPIGEGNAAGSGVFARPWAIPLVVGLGGLISGILVFRFAPEAEGHGTDAAISAVHHNPRGIRARVSFIKIIASAFTIGAGGSGGREGPTAQISAGFGSMLARVLDLTPEDARVAVTVGIGSGIGAVFRAPLGGAVLGAEVLYREDFEVVALIPSLIASIVGFAIFGVVKGFTPIFGFMHGYRFRHPVELIYYAGIGVAAGLLGRLYSSSFYGVSRAAKRLPGNRMLKPAAAGLVVGLIGLALPGTLGTGYGWVQRAMGQSLLEIPLWVVLALPFAKIVATSLSIGSGGSGGIFGPGMVIGGFLGAGAWRLLEPVAPGIPHSPAPFVIVGMIACFGSVAHAPLALMLMVAEMTGSLELLAPAMVAIGLATLVVGDKTIYESQLRSRADSPAERLRFGMPLLSSIATKDAMSTPRLVLPVDASCAESLQRVRSHGLSGAPVIDASGVYRGAIEADLIEQAQPDERVGSVVDGTAPAVPMDSTLDAPGEILASGDARWVPVLDDQNRVVGIVAAADLIHGYRLALETALRRMGETFRGSSLIERRISDDSTLAGKAIAEIAWPPGTIVIAAQRDHQMIFPRADTQLEKGDVLSVLARMDAVESVTALIGEQTRSDDGRGADLV
jgi:H+/Cl- antiporter ClcA